MKKTGQNFLEKNRQILPVAAFVLVFLTAIIVPILNIQGDIIGPKGGVRIGIYSETGMDENQVRTQMKEAGVMLAGFKQYAYESGTITSILLVSDEKNLENRTWIEKTAERITPGGYYAEYVPRPLADEYMKKFYALIIAAAIGALTVSVAVAWVVNRK